MTSADIASEATVASSARANWFRPDVDGLRAVAIVLVVGYHAGLPFFGGGFIGVDVFFVISGFLISRNLVREVDTTDRVALGGFWSRRIRRLVPALALVVTTTLVVGAFVIPSFNLATFALRGGAAALYVSNLLFAVQSQDYFAAEVSASPFLHTWSLGVEEQFYVVWPLVFAGACWSQARRLGRRSVEQRRRILAAVFGLTLVASLALSVSLTASGSSWAFFGLPSRAWEFAAAGLLAVIPVPSLLRGVAARTGVAIAGLVVLAIGCALIEDATPYPGLWALLPVGGTVLLIVAGERWDGTAGANPVSRMLALPPLQWLGRVSYSWYLWHWPAIVLVAIALDDASVPVKTAAALASLPVAWLAYRYVETPLRFSKLLAASHRRTYTVGALITSATLIVALAVGSTAPSVAADPALGGLAGVSAPPGSSLEDRVAYQVQQYRDRTGTNCPKVGSVETPSGDKYCIDGDPQGERSVLLLGDSHAGQWRRTLDAIAEAKGIRLLVRQHSGCAPFAVLVQEPGLAGGGDQSLICQRQQAGNLRILDDLKPDAVIVANYAGVRDRVLEPDDTLASPERQLEIWRTATTDLIAELQSRSIAVGWIVDEPTLEFEAPKCLAKEGAVAPCEPDRDAALRRSGALLDLEREVLAERGVDAVLDLTPIICDDDRCRLEIDGLLVYVDAHHLTDEFAAAQRPELEALVDQLLAPGPSGPA